MIVAFLIALGAPGAAQPAAPISASAIDPLAVQEAERMLAEQGFDQQLISSAETTTDLMLAAMTKRIQEREGDDVPAEFLNELRQVVREHVISTTRAKLGEMRRKAAELYAQEFSRQELQRMRELGNDPVMVKARDRMVVMQPKLMALGAYTMRENEAELEAKIRSLVAKHLAGKEPADRGS